MMRVLLALRLVVAVCLPAAALLLAPVAARAQVGYDRPGGDYATFPVRSGDPAVCSARCDRDSRCRAWSFSYPAAGRQAECRLKSQVPHRVEDSATISGVHGSGVIEPRQGSQEYSMDRPGGDYRSFEIAANATGETCKSACDAESQCRAWTYMRPGYAGPAAQCYLKNRVMPPRHRPCCISGVVR